METKQLKTIGIIILILEIWFAFMYGFLYSYHYQNISYQPDTSGFFVNVSLCIVLLIGFGLLSTYLRNFSISGLILIFIILALTIQYYFLVYSLWVKTGLSNTSNQPTFTTKTFSIIELTNQDSRVQSSIIESVSIHQAIACALAMVVGLFSVLGRVGPFQSVFLVLIGALFYTLNQALFWRFSIADAGYCSRIFIFGSSLGLISSLILGKKQQTQNNRNYHSSRTYQTLALLGTIFIWVFIPSLSTINQLQQHKTTYIIAGPLNIWFALTSSTLSSFCISILINQNILIHDIIFSAFSGAIAFGASSDIIHTTFPPMLVGFVAGIASTLANSLLKKKINNSGIIDSQGTICTFLIPAIIGVVFSAIFSAIEVMPPYYGQGAKSMLIAERTCYGQGGYQLVGGLFSIGIGSLAGLLIGFIYKVSNKYMDNPEKYFNDLTYLKIEDHQKPQSVVSQQNIPSSSSV